MNRSVVFAVFLAVLGHAARAADKPALTDVDVVKINGVSITKSAAMDRTWKVHGLGILNEMMDEVVVGQAAKAAGVKADEKAIESRLARIRGLYKDEEAFKARLNDKGMSLEDLRSQIAQEVLREALIVKLNGITVTDDDIKKFFEANREKLGTQEGSRVRQILAATEKEARDYLAAVRAGADFAKLASQVSLDLASKDKGGDLGFLSRGMLQENVSKIIFALKPGEVSDPVRTDMGVHIFKVEETRPAKPVVFEEIRKDLKGMIIVDAVSKAWPGYIAELRRNAKVEFKP